MTAEPNVYSSRWFDFFHVGIDESRTVQEAMFVCSWAPLPDFRKLADVCCGTGRHARALSVRGYSVIGIDRDAAAIAEARKLGGGPSYVHADIREYRPEQGAFDVVIVMSQSFGYFDSETNRDVIDRLARSVREGGRVILDLWNPEFFAAHQGQRELETPRGIVRENKHVDGERLFVHLEYPDGDREQFEWQLFTPQQMKELAHSVGLAIVQCCTDFKTATDPSPSRPRIQFLLER